MLTKRLIYVVLFCMTSFHVIAQDSLLLRDYNYVKQQDIWLSQPNLAALTRFATANIVEAEASLTKGNGDFVNYYESSNTLQGNIHMESLYRLNQRIVFFGAIKYNNWSGRNMTGSAFIIPERRPFNLVEDSLTNAGKKHRDTYQLTGGLGIDVWQGLSLGVRIDYTSANYAKYKDLRHKNKLMDLQLTAGFYAPVTPWLNIGADYRYHRNTESVEFATYGKGDKVYKTLIDYGAFMGIIEQFGNEGYTDKTREMPLFEDAHGGSLQLEVVPAEALSLYGSFAFSHATGYYGRKSPYTITYTNHYRDKIKAIAALTYHLPSWYVKSPSRLLLPDRKTRQQRRDFPRSNECQRSHLLRILRPHRDCRQTLAGCATRLHCTLGHSPRTSHLVTDCCLPMDTTSPDSLSLSILPSTETELQ